MAPAGAARLNNMRWVLAIRLEIPCLRSTEVSPNAAGALCSIMAKKMIKEREVEGAVVDAPKAIPSAKAWITRPMVVADERATGGSGPGGGEEGIVGEVEWCGPRERFDSEICNGRYLGSAGAKASGRTSTKYMRMKPKTSDTPTQAWGSRP